MSGDQLFFGGIGMGLAIGGTGIIQAFGLVLAASICLTFIFFQKDTPHD